MMLKKPIISLFSLVVLIAVYFFVSLPFNAEASVDSLSGYAWSSNIGWISFNSANPGSGGGSYSVKYDSATKLLSDYAWSSNIGWISFKASDLNGCPTSPCNARVADNSLNGWARAVSQVGRNDGWDGWISLNGSNPNYGITKTGAALSGYAWGSTVVGWVSFSGGSGPDAYGVDLPTGSSASSLDVYLSDNKGQGVSGGVYTYASGATLPTSVKWDVQNTSGLACTSNVVPASFVSAIPSATDWYANGSKNLSTNLLVGTYTFGGTCIDGTTQTTDSVTLVITPPVVPLTYSLSASPASYNANFILAPSSPKTFNTTITLNRGAGFDQAVNLAVTKPAGFTVNLSSASFSAGINDSSITATILIDKATAAQGTNRVVINATTGGATPITSTLNIPIVVSKSSSSGEI